MIRRLPKLNGTYLCRYQQHRRSIGQEVPQTQAVDFFNVLTGPELPEQIEANVSMMSGTWLVKCSPSECGGHRVIFLVIEV